MDEKKLIMGGNVPKEPVTNIPWKLILSKAPVWALIISHFCHNWGTFILLTWMPTYYNQVLKFNLTESGLFCVLPWLTMAVCANVGGWNADTLVNKGFSITSVRKIMQSIGFLGPAFFLTQLKHVNTPALVVLCMACSQGSDAFSQSILYSNHQDIGPRYSCAKKEEPLEPLIQIDYRHFEGHHFNDMETIQNSSKGGVIVVFQFLTSKLRANKEELTILNQKKVVLEEEKHHLTWLKDMATNSVLADGVSTQGECSHNDEDEDFSA